MEKQQDFEKKFASILSDLKNKYGSDPAGPDVQQQIRGLMDMFKEIVGEDLLSFTEKLDGAGLEEENPMQPLPLTPAEEEWVREAIKISMKNININED
jgi:hypothetical protein